MVVRSSATTEVEQHSITRTLSRVDKRIGIFLLVKIDLYAQFPKFRLKLYLRVGATLDESNSDESRSELLFIFPQPTLQIIFDFRAEGFDGFQRCQGNPFFSYLSKSALQIVLNLCPE
jgi:hypothetical protein